MQAAGLDVLCVFYPARIAYLTVPLARLAEAAAARVDGVHMRQAVVGVHHDGARVTGVKLADGAGAACDACVIAVPPRRLAAILDDAPAYGIAGLGAFEAMPIVDVHLWYDRPVLGCDFAALLDSPVQWVFEKTPGYVCCSLSAADALVGRPESELVELGRSALAAVLPQAARARLLRGAATRDPEATFIPAPGMRRPGASTKLSNLVIAGAWTDTGWPSTIESAVRSGRTAAGTLFRSSAGWRSVPNARTEDISLETAHAV